MTPEQLEAIKWALLVAGGYTFSDSIVIPYLINSDFEAIKWVIRDPRKTITGRVKEKSVQKFPCTPRHGGSQYGGLFVLEDMISGNEVAIVTPYCVLPARWDDVGRIFSGKSTVEEGQYVRSVVGKPHPKNYSLALPEHAVEERWIQQYFPQEKGI